MIDDINILGINIDENVIGFSKGDPDHRAFTYDDHQCLVEWFENNGIEFTVIYQSVYGASINIPCPEAQVLVKLTFTAYTRPRSSFYDLAHLPGGTLDKMKANRLYGKIKTSP